MWGTTFFSPFRSETGSPTHGEENVLGYQCPFFFLGKIPESWDILCALSALLEKFGSWEVGAGTLGVLFF